MILEIRTRTTSMHESNKPNRCNGHTNLKGSLGLVYDSNKNEKSQYMYTLRVITVEKGTFTPLVFFVFGTTAPECKNFIRSLFIKIAEERGERYSNVVNWMRFIIDFMLEINFVVCKIPLLARRTRQAKHGARR